MKLSLFADSWRRKAACRNLSRELFFDAASSIEIKVGMTGRARRWRARQVCAYCPVAAECLKYAVDSGSTYGVFGGLDQRDRDALKRQPKERAALLAAAWRLHMDGLIWSAVADRLGIDPGELKKLCESRLMQRVRHELKVYAAWPLIDQGASPDEVAAQCGISYAEAEAMCKGMDGDPDYIGPRGEERGLAHADSGLVAC